ncbi:MAG: TauD/TfdA family dioxygenase [Rhodobacteraceae bacterium]|nr:TauD/TfdA family dioxygenase [Paracoccaceae bacterium]
MTTNVLNHPLVNVTVEDQGNRIGVTSGSGTRALVSARVLRFACDCDLCGDVKSGKRWLPPDMVPVGTMAETVFMSDPQTVSLTWADGHVSVYPLWQLQSLAVTAVTPMRPARFRAKPWDASLAERIVRVDCAAALSEDAPLFTALEALRDDGIVMLTDVPHEPEDTLAIASRFGPVRETSYGRVFDLISKPNSRVAGETSRAQLAHTDEPFRYAPPGFIMFHAIKTAAEGGGTSIMVDGFKVAQRLKETRPEAFDLLTRAGVTHRRLHEGEVHFETEAHVISLDSEGAVTGIRFNDRCLVLQPGDARETEQLLDALGSFSVLLKDESMQFRHQLVPGELLIFDNGRILHGRTEFDQSIGVRHLRSCNLDRDAVHSAFRTLASRFAPDDAFEVLYQGPIL